MQEQGLFLGFLLEFTYEKFLLESLDSSFTHLINHPLYLEKYFFENKVYLGKNLGKITCLEEILLAEQNVFSLLKKINNTFPYPLFLSLLPISLLNE